MKKRLLLTIALVISILSLSIIGVACNKQEEDKPVVEGDPYELKLTSMHYDEDSSYGLYFYGPNHEDDDDMVRAKDAVQDTDYFDPSKPTVIWIHGWEPDGSPSDMALTISSDAQKSGLSYVNYAVEYRDMGYNVATFQYQKTMGCHVADDLANIFRSAYVNVENTGYSMAYMFASELCMTLGEDYAQDITYLGHSCGSFVSIGVNYYVKALLDNNVIANTHLLASRLLLIDPYVNELGDGIDGETIYGASAAVSEDKTLMLSKFVCDLSDAGVATQIYFGMGMASSGFKTVKNFDTLSTKTVMVNMSGLASGSMMGDLTIHVLTRDWVLQSLLYNKLKDQNGNMGPSAALSKEEIVSLYGNKYEQVNKKVKLSTESLVKVIQF